MRYRDMKNIIEMVKEYLEGQEALTEQEQAIKDAIDKLEIEG